jgi:uncharacterized PurR-regulated membrane protein YhhQ (DUF165 family)
VGEGVDTMLFVFIAFYGALSPQLLFAVIISNYVFKVGFEIIMTPATYYVANLLKRQEQVDTFDYDTNFNPFAVKA